MTTDPQTPESTPDGFCVCNGPAANGRMRDNTGGTSKLDAIAARLEAATPGPWEVVKNFSSLSVRSPNPQARLGFNLVAQVPRQYVTLGHEFIGVAGHPDDDECTYRSDGTTYCGRPEDDHQPRRTGNADLIAHAPADLAALLAVVRGAAAANDRYMRGEITGVALSIDLHAAVTPLTEEETDV